MVIVLLSPTLQTLHMDSLSSTRHGTTLMGITKGYEDLSEYVLHLLVGIVFSMCFCVSLKDGYQQNYKRGTGQGSRGVSRGSTQAMRS